MATLPSSNTDSSTKTDRQATGAQPDNTPVGSGSASTAPGGGVTSISTGNGITASASTGAVTLTAKVDGTTVGFNGSGQLETLGSFVDPMTTLGDTLYENATPAPARLAGNITGRRQYLAQKGTGSASAAPDWTNGPSFNVMDFGALADSGTTDNTAAINEAITDLNTAGGGTLYFPGNSHYYGVSTGPLTAITVPCKLLGDGTSASQIQFTFAGSGSTNGFHVDQSALGTPSSFVVEDLFINGQGTGISNAAILFKSSQSGSLFPAIYINRLYIQGNWNYGINATGDTSGPDKSGTISDYVFVGSGVWYNSTAALLLNDLGGVIVDRCWLGGCFYGIQITGISEGIVINNSLLINVGIGVYCAGSGNACANLFTDNLSITFYLKGVAIGEPVNNVAQVFISTVYGLNGGPSLGGSSVTFHTGTGAPSSGVGSTSDFYADTSNGNIYIRTSGGWSGVIGNIGTQYLPSVNGGTSVGTVVEVHGYDNQITNIKCLQTGPVNFYYGIIVDDGANAWGTQITNCYLRLCVYGIWVGSAAQNTQIANYQFESMSTAALSDNGIHTTVTNQRGMGANPGLSTTGTIVEGPWCGAKALLKLTSSQTISDSTLTPVSWSALGQDDSAGTFWVVSSPTLISVPAGAVKMTISANMKFVGATTGSREIYITDQSGNILAGNSSPPDIAGNVTLLSVALIDFDLSIFSTVTSFIIQVYQSQTVPATLALVGSTGVGAHNCMISCTR